LEIPLIRPSGIFFPTGGEGWDEGHGSGEGVPEFSSGGARF
jgi:hypothetical protein